MSIKLNGIIPIINQKNYKLHLACWNKESNPLDVFVKSWKEWENWNAWRGNINDFNREYIFSLIDFYHEPETWLFGGIFRVLSRGKNNHSHSYKVELVKDTESYIGRLKFRLKRPARIRSVKLEKYYDNIVVSELLKEKYTGEEFCGYENINHNFYSIESIYKTNRLDWKVALVNVKGVYLITDKSNGKRYVGSAYGDSGIWSRWSCYIGTGHGWNDELIKIINKKGIEYARRNFIFAILEYRSMKTDDKIIIERENYWKKVLLSRGEFGYNKN